MTDKLKTTRVTFGERDSDNYRRPSTYCIRDALGDFIYVHTRSRAIAEAWAKEEYSGKYRLMTG